MSTAFQGEHLLPGQLGQFFIVLAFGSALFSAISYYFGTTSQNKFDNSWQWMGRIGHFINTVSVIGVGACLFYIVYNSFFEYYYAWEHSSRSLPAYYIISSFWDGQEGSFWLWSFWQAVLGNIIIWKAKSWEKPVMTIIALAQALLISFLLGIEVFGIHIGSSPFILLRVYMSDIPFFRHPQADYLSFIKDGQGLNPLLQNYWMIIHPPILFLGFGSMVVPFAYAVAGLWQKRYKEWVQPAISYGLFAVMILGTGVVMGSMWAYESLNFGGFWAWDPVENASLVPWLTMVAAGHLMLIQRNKGTSVLSLFIFTLLTFCLVLYSTFLTRSGILGDSSVHAFTDLGMSGQLLLYLLAYVVLSIVMVASRNRAFPKPAQEESIWSREFWMFIGSLILFLSAFQIIFSTSFPVINKILGTKLAPSADRIDYYNQWQMPLAIVIALLLAMGQFLKYTKTKPADFFRNLSVSGSGAALVTLVTCLLMRISNPFVIALLLASTFAALANLDYWLRILNGKFKNAGSSIAHVGFGLLLLGALISTSQSRVISENSSMYDVSILGGDLNNNENILLMQGDTLFMGDYFVSYRGKEEKPPYIHYAVDYMQSGETGKLEKVFTLYPFVQLNPRMGNVAEPYTKHYLNKDIYTHISYAELDEGKNEVKSKEHTIRPGDTIYTAASFMVLDSLNRDPHAQYPQLTANDLAVSANFTLFDAETKSHQLHPVFAIRDRQFTFSIPDSLPSGEVKIYFEGIDPENQTFKFKVMEKRPEAKDFIVMKAIVFPGINILWLGCIIMALGSFIAVYNRIRRS